MTQAESIMRVRGIKRKERERILDGLLVMEAAALLAMYGDCAGDEAGDDQHPRRQ